MDKTPTVSLLDVADGNASVKAYEASLAYKQALYDINNIYAPTYTGTSSMVNDVLDNWKAMLGPNPSDFQIQILRNLEPSLYNNVWNALLPSAADKTALVTAAETAKANLLNELAADQSGTAPLGIRTPASTDALAALRASGQGGFFYPVDIAKGAGSLLGGALETGGELIPYYLAQQTGDTVGKTILENYPGLEVLPPDVARGIAQEVVDAQTAYYNCPLCRVGGNVVSAMAKDDLETIEVVASKIGSACNSVGGCATATNWLKNATVNFVNWTQNTAMPAVHNATQTIINVGKGVSNFFNAKPNAARYDRIGRQIK